MNSQELAAVPADGEVVTAHIAAIDTDSVTVALGEQRWQLTRTELSAEPKVGDAVAVFVDTDARSGKRLASKTKADALLLWDKLDRATDELVGEVVAVLKGGVSLDIGTRAFMPASQIALRPVADLWRLVGQKLRVRVLEFDKKSGSIIVSHRAVVEAERAVLKKQLFEKLAVGDVLTGTVVAFAPYGAFVDLGGLDGLLRLEDMSWGHVRHASQLFSEGQEVRVKVLEIQGDKERVALGVKQLADDPWGTVPRKYAVGNRVKAKVLRLVEFGAFVELEPNVEGLVHVSEMRWGKPVRKPSEVVQAGQTIEVQVLAVETKERRIALGLRQLAPNPWSLLRERYKRGAKVRGTVQSVTEFGAFIELETGVDGLLHASDMSWTERVRPSDLYKVGDEVEAALLDVDIANERVALGAKQLTPDPWDAVKHLREGAKVTGKVTSVAEFGVFIEVAPGITGLCHLTELTDDRAKKAGEVAKVGDTLSVQVLGVDYDSRRISLSLLALESSPTSYRQHMQDSGGFGNSLGAKLAKKLGDLPKK
jgi:small subunit ribosomal protein S1